MSGSPSLHVLHHLRLHAFHHLDALHDLLHLLTFCALHVLHDLHTGAAIWFDIYAGLGRRVG